MSDAKKNIPMHKKITADLLKKIQTQYYKENEYIPKEVDLANYYGVSRPTMRRAIQSLVSDGYLERKRRKGTLVKRKKVDQEFTHVIESYDTKMRKKGYTTKTQVLNFKVIHPNAEVAKQLHVKKEENVYKLIRLRFCGKYPFLLAVTYLPAKLLPDFLKIDFSSQRLYDVLEKRGYSINSMTRKLEVMKADETTAALLDIEINDPVFYFHSLGCTNDHVPIEYTISKYRGDLNSFVFKINTGQ
ncbi:MAG: GntR family transcriptional regulator [Sporolactobacillus sp.]|jgi:GntR family transcriptional regulator|nr:GntR family transcriptional regulator [Sporolactobacillus sp.]